MSLDRPHSADEYDAGALLGDTLSESDRGLGQIVDRVALKTAPARLEEDGRPIVMLRYFADVHLADFGVSTLTRLCHVLEAEA